MKRCVPSTERKCVPVSSIRSVISIFGVAALAALAVAFGPQTARAQSTAQEQYSPSPTALDHAEAQGATRVYRHARAAHPNAAAGLKNKEVLTKRATPKCAASQAAAAAATSTAAPRPPAALS